MKRLSLSEVRCRLDAKGLHISPLKDPTIQLSVSSGDEFEAVLALARGVTKREANEALGEYAFNEFRQSGILVEGDQVQKTFDSQHDIEAFTVLGYQISLLLSNLEASLIQTGETAATIQNLISLKTNLEALVAERQSATIQCIRDKYGPPGDYKLLLGAGAINEAGWISCDILDGQKIDLRLKLPFPDDSVSAAYGSFVVEHLIYPFEVTALFKELKRVMRSEAHLRIVVPHGQRILKEYTRDAQMQQVRVVNYRWTGPFKHLQTPFASLLFYLGAAAGLDLGPRTHKFCYDLSTLEKLVESTGFRAVRQSFFEDESSMLSCLDRRSQSIEGLPKRLCLFVEMQS